MTLPMTAMRCQDNECFFTRKAYTPRSNAQAWELWRAGAGGGRSSGSLALVSEVVLLSSLCLSGALCRERCGGDESRSDCVRGGIKGFPRTHCFANRVVLHLPRFEIPRRASLTTRPEYRASGLGVSREAFRVRQNPGGHRSLTKSRGKAAAKRAECVAFMKVYERSRFLPEVIKWVSSGPEGLKSEDKPEESRSRRRER